MVLLITPVLLLLVLLLLALLMLLLLPVVCPVVACLPVCLPALPCPAVVVAHAAVVVAHAVACCCCLLPVACCCLLSSPCHHQSLFVIITVIDNHTSIIPTTHPNPIMCPRSYMPTITRDLAGFWVVGQIQAILADNAWRKKGRARGKQIQKGVDKKESIAIRRSDAREKPRNEWVVVCTTTNHLE